ncbi:sensor domain-containing diguanylate cyclase [Thalassotalea profundi]|uniref:diguanylate cyclase n=1 Tax=Thalassotalea profundi TaxID=2036687 RepID=A0ABQ3IW47_9GAMM|nr:sensor domain-containing diguanylate cyclase [Thalassotalea profundi]GHE94677.1 diguanylate cyclase [Thalassotalea profundi]
MENIYKHQTVEQSDNTLNSILALIVEGVWDWNSNTGQVTRSPGWFRMLEYEIDYSKNDVFTWENIIHPDDYSRVMKHFESYLYGKLDHYEIQYRCRKSDGSYLWIVDRGKAIEFNQDGSVARMIGAHHNIDKQKSIELEYSHQNQLLKEGNLTLEKIVRKKAEQLEKKNKLLEKKLIEIKSISNIDSLTKVANRNKFENELEQEVLRANRYHHALSLVIFDIDHFKEINDSYGHKVGDRILCHLSELVSANIRDVDLLARWGGDEFVIIFPELCREKAHIACEKLKALINENKMSDDISVSCSFGVSQYKLGDTLDELFQRVDNLLYYSKEKGRNTVQS